MKINVRGAKFALRDVTPEMAGNAVVVCPACGVTDRIMSISVRQSWPAGGPRWRLLRATACPIRVHLRRQ
jgi:hypothetical protein